MVRDKQKKTSLILSGGGARAAYQVGVLMAVADIVPNDSHNPFDIICGTSAGAINATALATHASNYRSGVRGLERMWGNLTVDQIYRADLGAILQSIWHWVYSSMRGGRSESPVALLDNSPLRRLLSMVMNVKKIQRAIDAGDLHAISITASGYTSGESVSFFQGVEELEPWHRIRRVGIKANLSVDHLMASSAIPAIFPAIKVNREYFGDGAVRQLAPISPALHLGADKVMVIGVSGYQADPNRRVISRGYPSFAQVTGHLFNSAFIDSLESDVERLERINRIVRNIPEDIRTAPDFALKEIDVLKIFPSQHLDSIAERHVQDLPKTLRYFLSGSGATKSSGSSILSYLLFESGFCRDLMDLGRRDAMERKDEILSFLGF